MSVKWFTMGHKNQFLLFPYNRAFLIFLYTKVIYKISTGLIFYFYSFKIESDEKHRCFRKIK